MENVQLLTPSKTSSWRKVALGTWAHPSDPSVYGVLEVEVEPALAYIERLKEKTGVRITFTHFVGKALAVAIARHPQINSIIRFGRFYPRKSVDIFFQVATDPHGNDLSGVVLRSVDKIPLADMAKKMEEKIGIKR